MGFLAVFTLKRPLLKNPRRSYYNVHVKDAGAHKKKVRVHKKSSFESRITINVFRVLEGGNVAQSILKR